MKLRLLERLNQSPVLSRGFNESHRQAQTALWRSIEQHVEQLLNTRHGACLSQPNLGLPSVSPLSLQGDHPQAKQLCQVMQTQITAFEPRLTQVSVSVGRMASDRNGQEVHYQLEAYTFIGQETWRLNYRINIDSDGLFKLFLEGSQPEGQRHNQEIGQMVKL